MDDIEQFLREKRKYRNAKRARKPLEKKKKAAKTDFFDMVFRQIIVVIALFIFVFTMRVFPVSNNIFNRVKNAICRDYTEQVISVYNKITKKASATLK